MNTPTGKIAVITGGSRGLGKNMALALAKSGIDSIITYKSNRADADAVVAEITELGRKSVALSFDVERLSGIGGFLQAVSVQLQSLWNTDKFDFLVNNAGIGATIPITDATEADFDQMLNIHFKGVYFLTQQSLPMMNDGGRIINISSGTTRFCVPGYSLYASMKAGVEMFTKYLAKEIGGRGMTANVLAPGAIETDFNGAAIRNNPQMKGYLASQTALGRVGEANDIGGIVAFLCSPEAGWINGQRIEASGGMFL
ncbi:MAG: SDR family oxidoreductase [Candidatus Kapabacteria bacterium]|jgi:NAD(P)-dependent dehydrogenase (short-subunit alcohol dehydrogenase family)|nr:SDR family oxidoreductase [Candidatus Kapabacteria bacterium]